MKIVIYKNKLKFKNKKLKKCLKKPTIITEKP